LRILIVHNRYKHPGGEDAVVQLEAKLLRNHGNEVYIYECSNKEIYEYSFLKKVTFLLQCGWSRTSYNEIKNKIKEFEPDIVHFHNISYVLTPSVYQACKDEGIPVIQSLHNFRPLCLNALLLREGKICEDCPKNKNFISGVLNKCYKNSFMVSLYIAFIFTIYKGRRIWSSKVTFYIAATEFVKKKYAEYGFDKDKFFVKPNISYPSSKDGGSDESYALYVGRLSEEKGVDTLLEAWALKINIPLKIIGNGDLSENLKKYAEDRCINNVEFLGFIEPQDCEGYLKNARFLIIPSVCYENFPRVLAEAFSCNVPVIASNSGAMTEIVKDGETGLLFDCGDPKSLRDKVGDLVADQKLIDEMKRNITNESEKYSAEVNYRILLNIYEQAIKENN